MIRTIKEVPKYVFSTLGAGHEEAKNLRASEGSLFTNALLPFLNILSIF
jgi:hypothetical protein